MMGKFDVLSLELVNALDYKYDETKLDLLKHLIFHVRNLEVLEKIVVEKPHQINFLDQKAFSLLLNIVEKYLEVLKRHISKNYDYLDELLYYDRVLQVLFNNGKERLFLKEIQTLEEIFENALEHHPFLGGERGKIYLFYSKMVSFFA